MPVISPVITKEVGEALVEVTHFLQDDVTWAVDGSCALALQGLDVTPHDIDILTDAEDAYRIEEIFQEFSVQRVKYGETEEWRSHFGIFSINSVKVEVMGDLQSFRDGKWSKVQNPNSVRLTSVRFKDVSVPVVSTSFLKSTGYLQRRLNRVHQK